VSVTAPAGFRASGVAAGFKASGRPDLGLLVSDAPAAAGGLFTRNAFAAAPVVLTRRHLSQGTATAVIVNSGQANAGTGPAGLEDAAVQARLVSEALGLPPEEVAVCSTGVIGSRIPMDVFTTGLPEAVSHLDGDRGHDFARAILTTDSEPKETWVEGPGYRVGGCAKGAGMIAPDLATLLVFLTSDAQVGPGLVSTVLREEAAPVWNAVTVDGCSSTNDTVLLLANGAAGGDLIPETGPVAVAFGEAVGRVCEDLARMVVRGAEGATHSLVVLVEGAASADEARAVARHVAGSLLVKTAVFGGDPNPGRILQAVGASGARFDPAEVSASLGNALLVEGGEVREDREAAIGALKEDEVVIRIRLGTGSGTATAFGCDLGYEYVRINAEYRT
jgi:glutamate N-acetyltransferase/amino-acid N-acetyltransferase